MHENHKKEMVGIMQICITGHRPNKLFGYDFSNPKYLILKEKFKQILIEKQCTEAITGMAIGTDILFAIAVLELKNEGHILELHCAIPCDNQEKYWNAADKQRYHQILQQADKVTFISHSYTKSCMQKRNIYMVDNSDVLIAVWDGSNSGTKNCVDYARSQQKEIIQIHPNQI